MIAQAFVRQFAAGQKIDLDVADQEVVLHYALARLNEIGLVGYPPGEQMPGPLLFKGGTALRKCIFGSTGRFSQDIDLDATHKNGFEEAVEAAFQPAQPYYGIEFSLPRFRYSSDDNFSGTVEYHHANGEGAFELQISYRLDPILEPVDLTLQEQSYYAKAGEECGVPRLFGLDPYEMIGEKIMACNRRQGGSSKDVYDLDLWASGPLTSASCVDSPFSRPGRIDAASPAMTRPRSWPRSSHRTSAGATSRAWFPAIWQAIPSKSASGYVPASDSWPS